MAYLSRRHLMLGAGAAGFASSMGALTGLAGQTAWAAETSGYKALVCIFLFGGRDHADTVIPYDQSEYNYLSTTIRQSLFSAYNSENSGSSRNRNNLLRLDPSGTSITGGRQFALPPELGPVHDMFNAGDLAIVGNVGPLIEPTSRAAIENETAILPRNLNSHNDQQSTWMAFQPEGARFGWGGLFADRTAAASPSQNAAFASISAGSNAVFSSGMDVSPFTVTRNGASLPSLIEERSLIGNTNGDNAARAAIQSFLTGRAYGENNVYGKDLRASIGVGLENSQRMLEARENAVPFSTQFPENGVGKQLSAVADTIRIQQFLNVNRQVFFVSTGAYDTHGDQSTRLVQNHTQLAGAMAAFKAAMQEIGRWNDVTMFTASDFGRTQSDNGDGTDHGWGGHHFVAGGSVRGGRFYGSLPVANPSDSAYTGRSLIPTVSVEQYAATMGRWFGLDSGELNSALPNLSNFNNSDIGFMSTGGS